MNAEPVRPESTSVPAPLFVMPYALPPSPTLPPNVSVPEFTAMAEVAPRVTMPPPMFRLWVPMKSRLEPSEMATPLLLIVTAPPEALSSSMPDPRASAVALPMAKSASRLSRPAWI